MKDEHQLELETQRCKLCLLRTRDAERISVFYKNNLSHFSPWEPTITEEKLSGDYWKLKALEAQTEFENDESVKLNIFLKETNDLIGMINFTRLTRGVFHCCNVGYKLGREFEGRGLMKESLYSSIEYMFEELNFHRIEANYIPTNKRSEKLLSSLGFESEGIAKNYLLISGHWQDHVLTSLTNLNWRSG